MEPSYCEKYCVRRVSCFPQLFFLTRSWLLNSLIDLVFKLRRSTFWCNIMYYLIMSAITYCIFLSWRHIFFMLDPSGRSKHHWLSYTSPNNSTFSPVFTVPCNKWHSVGPPHVLGNGMKTRYLQMGAEPTPGWWSYTRHNVYYIFNSSQKSCKYHYINNYITLEKK